MTIKGNTRIQKYGFLTSQLYSKELTDLSFYDDWVPYNYGPHSAQLSQDLGMCVKQDLIEEKVEKTSNDRLLHSYSLKIRGIVILNNLTKTHDDTIKNLYEKFTQLNKKPMNLILKDIYEAYPEYTVNSEIKDEVLKSTIPFKHEFKNEKFNQEIEHKLEMIQSGNAMGKKYSPSEYLQHVNQTLED